MTPSLPGGAPYPRKPTDKYTQAERGYFITGFASIVTGMLAMADDMHGVPLDEVLPFLGMAVLSAVACLAFLAVMISESPERKRRT